MEEDEAGPSVVRPPEELRCCRGDGKRWRCKKPRITGLSFCHSHHHQRYSQRRRDAMRSKNGVQQIDGSGEEQGILKDNKKRKKSDLEKESRTGKKLEIVRKESGNQLPNRNQLRLQQKRQTEQPAVKELMSHHLPEQSNKTCNFPMKASSSEDCMDVDLQTQDVEFSKPGGPSARRWIQKVHGYSSCKSLSCAVSDVSCKEINYRFFNKFPINNCEQDPFRESRHSMIPLKLGETSKKMLLSVNSSVHRFEQESMHSACPAETIPEDQLQGIIFLVSDLGVVYVVQDVTPLDVDFALSRHSKPQKMLLVQTFEQSMKFLEDSVMGKTSFDDQAPRLCIRTTTSPSMSADPLSNPGSEVDDFIIDGAKIIIRSLKKKLMDAESFPPADLLIGMMNRVTDALVGLKIPTSSWTKYSCTLVKHSRDIEELETAQRQSDLQVKNKDLEDARSIIAALKEIHQRATTNVEVAEVAREKSRFLMKVTESRVFHLEKELQVARDQFSEATMEVEQSDEAFRVASSMVEELIELIRNNEKLIARGEEVFGKFEEKNNLLKKHVEKFKNMVERLDDFLF